MAGLVEVVDPPVERLVPPPGTTGEARRRRTFDLTVLVPLLVTLAVGGWSLSGASYWRDEAATLDADSRSIPALLRMLTHVDAVHGAYYLLMWPVVHVFGTTEAVVRLPSLLAMAVAAAGLAAIGRRLQSSRAGLLAGLAFAVLPQVSLYAQTARSYAMVLACAVLASYLLVRAVAEPGRRWLAGYGCAIAVLGLLNLFGLLLLVGHAVFLLACRRTELRRWLAPAVLGCLPAMPIVALAWHERGQLDWLLAPGLNAPQGLVEWLAGSAGAVVPVVVVITLGLPSRTGPGTTSPGTTGPGTTGPAAVRPPLPWLALPWLIAPPVLLMAGSAVAVPVYTPRYVVFCLPALALLIGAGLDRIHLVPRLVALLLIAGLPLPVQLAERQPGGHSDNFRAVAAVLSQHEHPGDGVFYDCAACTLKDLPREAGFAYPASFRQLDDVTLAASPAASGTLTGTDVSPATLARRLDHSSRVWLVEMLGGKAPASLAASGLHRVVSYHAGDVTISLYERSVGQAASGKRGISSSRRRLRWWCR